MQLDAEVFTALLRRLLPRVHKHLQQVGVGPLLYLPEWFLCLFARSLPFPTVLRVWDAFLSEGEWTAGGEAWPGLGASGCAQGPECQLRSAPPATANPGPGRGCQSVPRLMALGWLWGEKPSPRLPCHNWPPLPL